jgi:glutaredoxin
MIILYVLVGCPYCNKALNTLNQYNIKYRAITVPAEQKENIKKQNRMNTFPQIFLQINSNNYIKIGGSIELDESINQCNMIKNSDASIDSIYYMYQNMFSK